FAHAMRSPWGFPHDLNVRAFTIGQAQQLVLYFSRHHRAHRASGRGERQLHVHSTSLDRDSISQSKIDDIDWDLGVVAFAQDFVDFFFRHHIFVDALRVPLA